MTYKTVKLALAGTLLVAGLAGCSNSNQQSLPDPVTNHYLTRQVVFTEPDGFRNVSFGCNGTVGVYVTSRGAYKNSGADVASLPSAVAVVADDPNCKP
jgi:uncharacterized secreted protein with C-terminal beta-propeller domain